MLEEYKAQTITLMLGGLYKFDVDTFNFSENCLECINHKGSKTKIEIKYIDCDANGSSFVFDSMWFKDDIKNLLIVSYRNGFIIINQSKIRRYLVEFKPHIERLGNGICRIQNKFLPNDNSYWVVTKRSMIDEEKKNYQRDS